MYVEDCFQLAEEYGKPISSQSLYTCSAALWEGRVWRHASHEACHAEYRSSPAVIVSVPHLLAYYWRSQGGRWDPDPRSCWKYIVQYNIRLIK